MRTKLQSMIRKATRDDKGPLNILTFPTHERYQCNLAKTGHNFYLWQEPGVIKPWVKEYAEVPENTTLLNPSKESDQIPINIDLDVVLSQNKFGQFNIASQIASMLDLPLISIEHTLPMESWNEHQLESLYNMKGNINIFISDYSRGIWGWTQDEADVIHHGVDTDFFCPTESLAKENSVLSVVNDWINRDWCCGYSLWEQVTGYPESNLPLKVIGDTPGLSEAAQSTGHLAEEYKKSKIFLNTSLISPVPTCLLEAMSCGCAVVSTETCMIPEIITNGQNGFISNDPKKLRSYIDILLKDDEMSKEIGLNARKTIVNNFGLKNFINQWNAAFQKSLELV
tara:strand:+ start:4812 stop:5831 length:1020 start_codon:yes stop_codon:yes gene_type:complete